jgi:putative ABC transport system ATP-binding protein
VLLSVRNLRTHFCTEAGLLRAVENVSFNVAAGEIVGIVGESGSGKTVLGLSILRLIPAETGRIASGSIRFDGVDVASCSDTELSLMRATRIGFVFQTFHLINIYTVIENVALPLVYARLDGEGALARAAAALADVGLSHRAGHLPSELSGGEMQRAAVARAMINDPALVLADEPTGNLDSRTGAEIMDVFERVNRRGTTIVIVTHNAQIAARAERQLELVDGAVREVR